MLNSICDLIVVNPEGGLVSIEGVSQPGYEPDHWDEDASSILRDLLFIWPLINQGKMNSYHAAEYLLWKGLTLDTEPKDRVKLLENAEVLYAQSEDPFSAAVAANFRGDKKAVLDRYNESCSKLSIEGKTNQLYGHVLLAGDLERKEELERDSDLISELPNLGGYLINSANYFMAEREIARLRNFNDKAPVLHALKDHLFARTYSTLRGYFMRQQVLLNNP